MAEVLLGYENDLIIFGVVFFKWKQMIAPDVNLTERKHFVGLYDKTSGRCTRFRMKSTIKRNLRYVKETKKFIIWLEPEIEMYANFFTSRWVDPKP